MPFTKTRKERVKLRLALYGPPGGGKTYTMLSLLLALAGDADHFGVIDTEHESASMYAPEFGGELNISPLSRFTVQQHLAEIKSAQEAGFTALGIDSFSHSWEGNGGILERKDELESKSTGQGWSKVRPEEKALWNAVLTAPMHVIATMRSKNEWRFFVNEKGREQREIVGLEPIQRKGMEYEFNVVVLMEPSEDETGVANGVRATVEKSRFEEIPRGYTATFSKGTPDVFADFVARIMAAISAGELPEPATDEDENILVALLLSENKEEKGIRDVLAAQREKHDGILPATFVADAIARAHVRIAAATPKPDDPGHPGEPGPTGVPNDPIDTDPGPVEKPTPEEVA